ECGRSDGACFLRHRRAAPASARSQQAARHHHRRPEITRHPSPCSSRRQMIGSTMHGKRPTLSSLHGLVAAAHPLAAQAAAKLLANGGNAFDAAAATAAALNVVEPFMSGLAGLGYASCYIGAERRVRVLDFVPPVPSRLPVERFSKREDLQRGALSVGIPGNLA